MDISIDRVAGGPMVGRTQAENEKLPTWAFVWILVLGTVAFLITPFIGGASPLARTGICLVLAVFPAIVLRYGSRTTSWGQFGHISFHAWGPAATFIVLLPVLLCASKPATQSVRVYLNHRGQPLDAHFELRAQIRHAESPGRPGDNGEVLFELSSDISEIDAFIFKLAGYKLRDLGPYKINDGVIRLETIKTESTPMRPGEYPSVTIVPKLPSRSEVNAKPAFAPDEVTLHYRNLAGDPIDLLMLDCSRYYKILDERIEGGEPWLRIPIEPADRFLPFNGFIAGTGWYCCVVRDRQRNDVFVGKWNLFQHLNNRLTISSTDSGQFKASMENE